MYRDSEASRTPRLLKFSFSEKATKIWKNLLLVLTLQSKNSCFVKTSVRFFPILWPSHNVLTLWPWTTSAPDAFSNAGSLSKTTLEGGWRGWFESNGQVKSGEFFEVLIWLNSIFFTILEVPGKRSHYRISLNNIIPWIMSPFE